jgi:cell division protein FtsL
MICEVKVIVENMDNFIEIATLIMLVINLVTLLFVVHQTRLAKSALNATKQSIDDAKAQRQLEILPKFTWVIQVRVALEIWKKDLQDKQVKLKQAIIENNEDIFKELSGIRVKKSKDLALNRFLYDNMPSWLREIWMSGAQYYYNAIASMQFLWQKDDKSLHRVLAEGLVGRCAESEGAIDTLLIYIKDMVPSVILDTPASLSDEDFLRD